MTHVKNQHYVPRFLLKNFCNGDKKFIWTYDKHITYSPNNKIKERPIRKVASEEFFYDQIKNLKDTSFEYPLQEIESNAAPVINKIINDKKSDKFR